MRVRLTDDAIEDLRWTTHYYTHVFPNGLKNFLMHYDTTKMLLTENPFLGRRYERIEGVRILNIVKTPFSFIYRVTSEDIQILRVWDQRQESSRLRLS